MEAFNELQRLSGSPECAARYLETVADLDVRVPFNLGQEFAAGIPGAKFVTLESRNHMIMG